MADDFDTNAGSGGRRFAADEIGTALHSRVKPTWGGDGTGNDCSVATPLPVQASFESGQMLVAGAVVTPKFAAIAATSSGNNTLVSAVSAKKIRVVAANFIAAGPVNGKFVSGTSVDLTGAYPLVANSGAVLPYCPVGHFETGTNANLTLNLSAGTGVFGALTYIEV